METKDELEARYKEVYKRERVKTGLKETLRENVIASGDSTTKSLLEM